jgi:dimeric dUTPase (all-alpha-NTP-PPase superfamily)
MSISIVRTSETDDFEGKTGSWRCEMNLTKLFETQRVLDARIIEKQELTEVPLNNMILALITEIGEMSNDWGGFKHWKVNPQTKPGLLEEIADVFSFMLAIGNMLHHRSGVKDICIFEEDSIEREQYCYFEGITEQILGVTTDFVDLWSYGEITMGYSVTVTRFAVLTEMLGFTWDQVEQAYYDKNAINHERQESGY